MLNILENLSCLCFYLNPCTISTTIETMFCSSIQEGTDYIDASTRQAEATESKQCFMGVARVAEEQDRAIATVKKRHALGVDRHGQPLKRIRRAT